MGRFPKRFALGAVEYVIDHSFRQPLKRVARSHAKVLSSLLTRLYVGRRASSNPPPWLAPNTFKRTLQAPKAAGASAPSSK